MKTEVSEFSTEILEGLIKVGEFLVGIFRGGVRSIELGEFGLCFLEGGPRGIQDFGFGGDDVEGLGKAGFLDLISLKEFHVPVYLYLL